MNGHTSFLCQVGMGSFGVLKAGIEHERAVYPRTGSTTGKILAPPEVSSLAAITLVAGPKRESVDLVSQFDSFDSETNFNHLTAEFMTKGNSNSAI